MKPAVGLRGMVEFQCLGERCEDSCCTEWTIPVDEPHYHKLKHALARSGREDDRAAFERGVIRERGPGRGRERFAILAQDEQGRCAFLDGQSLCSLHGRFGEEVLADTCSMYPRALADTGSRLELAGALSCPEVARRTLLTEDATDLVPVPVAALGRGVVSRRFAAAPRRPWERALDDVRGAMLELAARASYPISSRLFFMAWLGHETAPWFSSDDFLDGDPRLGKALAALESPAFLDALHERCRAGLRGDAGPLAIVAILHALRARLDARVNPPFARLVGAALSSYAGRGVTPAPGGGPDFRVAPAELWSAYRQRRDRPDEPLRDRLEVYLANYLRQYWLREWYVFSPSLRGHVDGLLARVAMLRFLLLSQPRLDEIRALPPESRAPLHDQLAVEVFHSFARAVEHSDDFLAALAAALSAALPTLAHAPIVLAV